MKKFYLVGVAIFLASQFLVPAYAIELCQPQDYYNLADSTKCKIKAKGEVSQGDPRELMFGILKNYPYESKAKFVKLLQNKIQLLDNYLTPPQGQKQAEKSNVNIAIIKLAKQNLSQQLVLVDGATQNNWESVRDQAKKALEAAAERLREVE